MARTLPLAREAFVASLKRDTATTELPRLVAVLDALIQWSVARPDVLTFRPDDGATELVGFERTGTKVVFWSARVSRGKGASLEIYPPSGRSLSEEERANVMRTINQYSRDALIEGDRLRIGFGALKNVPARTAVLALMEQLLTLDMQTAK